MEKAGFVGSDWAGLAVAVVGVVGTLGAALLTQNRADRIKRLELQATAEQHSEERRHAETLLRAEQAQARHREGLELRRRCYIDLNTASRHFLTAMTNYLHALRHADDGDIDASLAQLETSRFSYRDTYAEAQMIAPHSVLRTAGIAKTQLNNAYGKIKRLGPSLVGVTTDLQALEDELHAKVWPHVGAQKNAMRSDLGVETDDD
ncbi:hypothetical protein PV620_05945 [Streptomyces sp. ME02-6978a]|uniref:hypothetical protein n=1 Tax=unclassified Streptomyces TaxID=2593676 RepID=UPI0029B5B351|nr:MULTISPECIES: hypothetical protein [unclassified Streptomyces]MDX3087707.1 hypothetical protein [Streptomyces sp. ME12-02E]MDX3331113.1 hypothetical protein [Streptomyces sp. ME02-6978a]